MWRSFFLDNFFLNGIDLQEYVINKILQKKTLQYIILYFDYIFVSTFN